MQLRPAHIYSLREREESYLSFYLLDPSVVISSDIIHLSVMGGGLCRPLLEESELIASFLHRKENKIRVTNAHRPYLTQALVSSFIAG